MIDYAGIVEAFKQQERKQGRKLSVPICQEIISKARGVKIETAKRDLKDLVKMRYVFLNQNRTVEVLI